MKLIVAVDACWGIGRENNLLFSVPEDKTFFRKKTTGKIIVMGCRTLMSLPNAAPLKNRTNIVLTTHRDMEAQGALMCNSIGHLNRLLSAYESDDVYVIGGHSVYEQLYNCCDEAYVTKIDADGCADRFFPDIDRQAHWVLKEQSDKKLDGGLAFNFCLYENKKIERMPL